MSLFRDLMPLSAIVTALGLGALAYGALPAIAGHPDASPWARGRAEPAGSTSADGPVTMDGCRAIDGDTLRCGRVRIRLLGIDAAELPGHCAAYRRCAPGDPFAQQAALAALVHGPLTVSSVDHDRYGRLVAQVTTADGTDLSCAMLTAGATYKPRWDDGYRIGRTCPSRAIGSY